MTNPKHNNPKPDRTAVAPYNFIPLPEKVVTVKPDDIPNHDEYTHNTGYIDCTLTTESPTYVRCAPNWEWYKQFADNPSDIYLNREDRERYAQFFNLNDAERPVIPGSSLRGMVRSLVEIAAFGKMQWVTDEKLIYREVFGKNSIVNYYREQTMGHNKSSGKSFRFDYPISNLQAGYLKHTTSSPSGWAIQPAIKWKKESFVLVKKNHAEKLFKGKNTTTIEVYVQPVSRTAHTKGKLTLDVAITPKIQLQESSGMKKATLIRPGMAPNRRWYPAVYAEDGARAKISISNELKNIYIEDCKIPRGDRAIRKLRDDGAPLFYLVDDEGKLSFFGHTMMFRLPYPNTPQDFVPNSVVAESNTDITDLAEAIFGYTDGDGQKRPQAYAGRVCFTDAHYDKNENGTWLTSKSNGIITPKILASPKPTSFQLCLTQNSDDPQNLFHYGTSSDETTIRGHKLYWHKGPEPEIVEDDAEKDPDKNGKGWKDETQHTQIKPVNRGVTFKFRIHFENLQDYELGALLWVLDLPANCRHKIGMGKPLGMGSVKITPKLVLSNRQKRYAKLFDDDWATYEDAEKDIAQFKEAFTDFVLENVDKSERKDRFEDLERIKMLLTMLDWETPLSAEQTRYMTLDNDSQKYRNRHVLPDPLHVDGTTHNEISPEQPSTPPTSPSTVPETASLSTIVKQAIENFVAPSAEENVTSYIEVPNIGEKFTCKIDRLEENKDLILQHPRYSVDELYVVVPEESYGTTRFNVKKDKVKCEVVERFSHNKIPAVRCRFISKKKK